MSRNVHANIKPELYKLYSKPLTIAELYLESPYTAISHRYVANNENITFGGEVYTALAAKRSSIRSEEGTVINELEVGLDNVDLEFQNLVATGAFNRKRCVIKLVFYGFLTNSANCIILYDGYLDAPKGDDHWVTLTLKPFPIFDRDYPRRLFQVGCNWTVGDDNCGLDLTDYDATIVCNNSCTTRVLNFTDAGFATNYFVPGYALITSGALLGQVRPIISNDNDSVTVRIPFSDVPVEGVGVTLQKLCAMNTDVCNDEFDNYLAYGGFPTVPKEPVL